MSDSGYSYNIRVTGSPGAEVTISPPLEVVSDVFYASSLPEPPPEGFCEVYWGSHGCHQPRGHPAEVPHECDCCECGEHHPYPDWPDEQVICVAKPPYYGPETLFYGDDAERLGLRLARDA